jgi:hypothetical protein
MLETILINFCNTMLGTTLLYVITFTMFCAGSKFSIKLDKRLYFLQHSSKEREASYYMTPLEYILQYRNDTANNDIYAYQDKKMPPLLSLNQGSNFSASF